MRYINGLNSWITVSILLLLLLGFACSKSSSSGGGGFYWHFPNNDGDSLSPSGTYAGNPAVSMDSGGSMVFAWVQSDGLDNRVFMAEYRNGWLLASDLGAGINPTGAMVQSPRTATAPNGEALIVWEQSNGTHNQVYISERLGGAWYHPTDLNDHISPAGANATAPLLSMEEDGDAIVTWRQWNGSNWQVFKSERRGGIWEHPVDLNDHISPAGQDVDDLTLAMNENNDALIAWRQSNGTNKQIFLSECRSGLWSHPADLTSHISPAGAETDDPALALNDYGEALVVWEQQRSGAWQIYMSEYFNALWNHPEADENISPAGTNAWGIDLALNNQGEAVITWEQWNSSHYRIYMSSRRLAVWDHPDFIDAISPAGSDASVCRVAIGADGETVIAWMQSNGTYEQIFRSHFHDGAWEHPLNLGDHMSPDGTNALFTGDLAIDSDGNCIIVWEQFDGVNWQLFYCQNRGSDWYVPPSVLSFFSLDGYDVQTPGLIMEPNGRGVVVWGQSDGANQRIFFSVYR